MARTSVSPVVEARPSVIEGLGLFACRPFAALEIIHRINVVRELTAAAPLRPELGERRDHCDYPDGKVVLIGPPDRHLNHCCDPNAWVRYDPDGPVLLARRLIATDDEITCDYSINVTAGDVWPCHCGAKRCRGRVDGDFFHLPFELQVEYAPYMAPWFVRQHRDRLRALGLVC